MAYIPPNTLSLDKLKDKPQIRLGIQGYPGSGKTWAALTFPNPVVINFDRGLGAHSGRSDVIDVPFYSEDFIKTIYPTAPRNRKDGLERWLDTVASKLEPDQTLVIDGATGIQNAFNQWVKENGSLFLSKKGVYDERAPWQFKLEYFDRIADLTMFLKCHVVYLAHEIEAKDKSTGEYTGKLRPLVSGQSGDKLGGYHTDWFRQLSCNKLVGDLITADKLKPWRMTKDEYVSMCNTFPGNTIYYWQTESDDYFDAKAGSLVTAPRFIPANYTTFLKYMRK